MSTKLLTNLLFEPKGVHDPALTYSIKDTVMSPDGSKVYFALRDVPSGIALTDKNYWMLQIDLSGSKNAMDEAVAAFADYAKIVGTRVKGETAKASGNPVSFLPDAGSLLQPVTVLEPQQAGSGDPYPAGGAPNQLCVLPDVASAEVYGITFSCSNGVVKAKGTATNTASSGAYISYNIPKGTKGTYFVSGTTGRTRVFMKIDKGGESSYPHQQSFTLDGTETQAMLFVQVNAGDTVEDTVYPMLNAGTSALPWEAPSNIRPITGYDAVELNHVGKNLMPVLSGRDSNSDGIEWKNNSDGSWTANGTATAAAYIAGGGQAFGLGILPAGEYKLNIIASSEETGKLYLRIGSGAGAAFLASNDSQSKDKECTFVADGVTEYYAAIAIKSGETVKDYRIFPVLMDSSHSVWSINFGQTVYGGKFDWLTGKLVVDRAMRILTGDNSETDYAWGGSYANKFISFKLEGSVPTGASVVVPGNIQCSHYPYKAFSANADVMSICSASSTSTTHMISLGTNPNITDVAAWKAYVSAQHAAGTPVQIAYKLATPIEIQLTPHIISAVEPEQNNTLYGDGTIEVEFVKPLHVSIEERVAAIASAMLMKEE